MSELVKKTYTSLHNHTHYSNLKLIDSINREDQLIDYAYELGLHGVAITDHDCVSGHVKAWNHYNKHYTEEQRKDFKLILGNEIYLCRSDLTPETHQKGEKFYHLILLAKDDIGHEQIRQISSRAWSRSYMKNIMRTPTFSEDLFDIIGKNPGHVIATTACLGGFCGVKFSENNYEAIERHLALMSELFGENNFYIELQPSWHSDQINYNRYMIENYWDKYPFVLSTDSHYLKKDDAEVHKYFLNSKSSGDREVDSFYASAYMMSYDEIKNYFCNEKGTHISEEKFEQICINTNKICDQIGTYNLEHSSVIPKIKIEPQPLNKWWRDLTEKYPAESVHIVEVMNKYNQSDIYLLNLLIDGWKERVPVEEEQKYVIEMDYEWEQLFAISEQLHQPMSDYFITMAKMIDIMWEDADSIVGPARGSAGSSLINYLLGITQINPLTQPLEMPFWRFIHAERPGLPD